MTGIQLGNGSFWRGDCLDLMRHIPDGSVDMVLCDLPYGTTACKWDAVLPFDRLWEEYWRVCKPNAAIVLFGAEPFSTHLRMSQFEHWRYDWYWQKSMPSGFALAKRQPMRVIEAASVFYKGQTTYNPQLVPTKIKDRKIVEGKKNGSGSNGGNHVKTEQIVNIQKEMVQPRNLLEIASVPNSGGHKIHPTQKPVDLFEYLIRTYTDEGMTVLDNCAGSGTTAIAAQASNRRWLCIERDPTYYDAAIGRVFRAVHGI